MDFVGLYVALLCRRFLFCFSDSNWGLSSFSCADGDMIVNIFTPEQRANYNLEGLWHEGEVADISDCLSEPSPEGEKSSSADDSLDDWV